MKFLFRISLLIFYLYSCQSSCYKDEVRNPLEINDLKKYDSIFPLIHNSLLIAFNQREKINNKEGNIVEDNLLKLIKNNFFSELYLIDIRTKELIKCLSNHSSLNHIKYDEIYIVLHKHRGEVISVNDDVFLFEKESVIKLRNHSNIDVKDLFKNKNDYMKQDLNEILELRNNEELVIIKIDKSKKIEAESIFFNSTPPSSLPYK